MPAESLDLSAAAALIPFWVRWGGVAAAILTALLTAGIGGAIATYVTLYRVRRLGDVEWPERARVTYIARQAISACVVTLALIAGGIAWIFAGPFSAISAWGLVGLTWTVAMAVGLSWRRYVAQRTRATPLPLRDALRGGTTVALVMYSTLIPLLVALPYMPGELGPDAYRVVALTAIAVLTLAFGAGIEIARVLGLIRPAPPRLRAIVEGVAQQLGITVRGVYEMEWSAANAFAIPLRGWMMITTGAAALLSDRELAAVAAHEIGHLGESRAVTFVRVLRVLIIVPLVLLIPLVAGGGWMGSVYVLGPMILIQYVFAAFSRRMEARADAVAHMCTDEGVYAATLETIHRVNLIPVVLNRGASHPDLYDRMVAAGVTPAYPRPAKPSRAVGPAALASALVLGGVLAAAVPLALVYLVRGPATDAVHLHASLLFDRSSHAGTIARLAAVHAADGDDAAAATLYRTAARLTPSQWSAAAYRASALAVGDRCGDAERLLGMAHVVYDRYYDDDWPPPSIIAAHAAVERCAARQRVPAMAAAQTS